MIFVKLNYKNEIESIHYQPFNAKYGLNKSQEQLETEGILIDSIPEAEKDNGEATLRYDTTAKKFYYSYEKVTKSDITSLQEQLENQNQAIGELTLLLLGGM